MGLLEDGLRWCIIDQVELDAPGMMVWLIICLKIFFWGAVLKRLSKGDDWFELANLSWCVGHKVTPGHCIHGGPPPPPSHG